MTGVRIYAVPAHDGTALVVPARALEDLRGAGVVLAAHPGRLHVQVLVAAPIAGDHLAEAARLVAQRAAVEASLPGPALDAGPHGRWYAALVIAGWLLLLFSGGSTAQMLAGLWLAVGLPWARAAYRRRVGAAADRAADGLRDLAADPEVVQLPHEGLRQFAAAWAATAAAGPPAPVEAYAAARRRAGAELPALEPFYAALAAGEAPPGVWGMLPRAAPSPASGGVAAQAADPGTREIGPVEVRPQPEVPSAGYGAATAAAPVAPPAAAAAPATPRL
jgi:hypothetical protein